MLLFYLIKSIIILLVLLMLSGLYCLKWSACLWNIFSLANKMTEHCYYNYLQLIHCLVDRIMEVIGTPFVPVGNDTGYYIQCSDVSVFFYAAISCATLRLVSAIDVLAVLMKEPEFLPGRQASITHKGKRVGTFGIVHPEVMSSFEQSLKKYYIWIHFVV